MGTTCRLSTLSAFQTPFRSSAPSLLRCCVVCQILNLNQEAPGFADVVVTSHGRNVDLSAFGSDSLGAGIGSSKYTFRVKGKIVENLGWGDAASAVLRDSKKELSTTLGSAAFTVMVTYHPLCGDPLSSDLTPVKDALA